MNNKDVLEFRSSYTVKLSKKLDKFLSNADELKAQIDTYQGLKEKECLWQTIQEKLRAEWTYNSNAIEGNTLTLGETIFFLQYGLTVEGKPFKDFLDAKNHAEAIDLLYEFIRNDRPISESLIKEINALLLSGITYTKAIDQFGNVIRKVATPGEYKRLPNTVLKLDGTIHSYVSPIQVPAEMQYFCDWISSSIKKIHPIIVSSIAHYNMVRIHPFDDGNGRGARILMNLLLLKHKYPPAVIKVESRREYLMNLEKADKGDLNPFVEFVVESLIDTQKEILEILKSD